MGRCALSDEYTFSWRKLSDVRLCLTRAETDTLRVCSFLSGMNGRPLTRRGSIQPRVPLQALGGLEQKTGEWARWEL